MTVDLSWALWRAGYRALPEERSAHAGAPAYPSRLVGRRAVVVRGRDGTRLFYDPTVIQRRGAIPPPLADLLFGRGAVHGLDDEAHAERKAMFLQVLAAERVEPLALAIGTDLQRRARSWRGRDVQLHSELVEVYGAAVLAWAGIDCTGAQARRTSHHLAHIVDGFGGAGAAYPRGWAARIRADRWARRLVQSVRDGQRRPPPGSPLELIATGPGRDLDARTAGVELLNLLRPTVAVAWPATFAALALAQHEQWRPLLRGDDASARRTAFGHEVRRTCPFVPALAGTARSTAEIHGERVEPGDLVVLDVPGTNHDAQAWTEPDEFLPERFADVEPDPYEFVPQGGGDPRTGHRCPGEPLTVRMLAETLRVLAEVDYAVVSSPSYDATRIPTLPARGLMVRVAP
ncbi:cytochrome P450 [Nocardioides sp. URHA0020]|uniref:cytochrome P450 n=1 Tax=Nocardioides sp. URHA0020 TaxID=1380392 RepID=UPI000686894D|nr:cytochrome P450 [Nocardioides sp. URHA0020]